MTGWVVSQPVKTLVGVVPDDAFYYLAIGRHLAESGHPSFDGENPASGFHPLWMLLVAGAARLFSDRVVLFRVVLTLSFCFHIASGFLLYRIFRRFIAGWVAIVAAGVWLFSYLPLLTTTFALETSLYCFTFLCSYTIYLSCIDLKLHATLHAKDLLLFGVSLGICILARTEGIVLLACASGWIGAASLLASRTWPQWREAGRRVFWTMAAALAAISPWMAYCLYEFGTIRQASGVMKTLWMQDQAAQLNFSERMGVYAIRIAEWFAFATPWTWSGGAVNLLNIVIAVIWLAIFWKAGVFIRRCSAQARQVIAARVATVAYPLLHIAAAGVVYSIEFADVQCWYLALPYLECFLAMVILAGAVWDAAKQRQHVETESQSFQYAYKLSAIVFTITLLCLVRFVQTVQLGYWPWQRDVYTQIEPVEKMSPPTVKIGCFNAGIPGYFGSRTIVNLDGLVNDTAVPYWRAKRFDDYLRNAHIGVIVDEEWSLGRAKRFSHNFPSLEEKARFPLTNFVSDKRFFWLLTLPDKRKN